MIRKQWGTLTQLQGMPGALSAMVGDGDHRLGLASLDLPPKATIDETETMLSEWGRMPAMPQKRLLIGFDCNETFDFDDGHALSRSARGETILNWALPNDLTLPLQQGAMSRPSSPTTHPSNHAGSTMSSRGDCELKGKGKCSRRRGR